jgi:hypothetical protein
MTFASRFTSQEQCLREKGELLLLGFHQSFQVGKLLAQIPFFQQNGRRHLPQSRIADHLRVKWFLKRS